MPRASAASRPTGVGRFCLGSLGEGLPDDTGREKGRENAKVGEGERDYGREVEAEERTNERANERTDGWTAGGALVVLRRGGKEEAAGAFDLGRGRRQSVRPLSCNGGPSLGCARESGVHVLVEERERREAERREKERERASGAAKDRTKCEKDG